MTIPQHEVTIYEVTKGAQIEVGVNANTGVVSEVSLRLESRWEDEQIGNPRIWEMLIPLGRPPQSTQQMLPY